MVRRIVSVLYVVALMLLTAVPASAHANLARSEPEAGATLQKAPSQIVLEFTENLDPQFSRVELRNSKNQIVNTPSPVIDRAQPLVMRLDLGALPNDSYTAVWRVRSADDGHVSEGNIPFGVGVAVVTTSLLPPVGAPEPATVPPPPLDSGLRWLTYLAAMWAFGGLAFGLLVWQPVYKRAGHSAFAQSDDAVSRAIRFYTVAAGLSLILVSVLFLIEQAARSADVPLAQAFGTPLVELLSGRSGQLVLARIALVAAVVVLAWRLPPLGQGKTTGWWIALALSAAALLTISLSGHSAAQQTGRELAVALIWLHLLAMVVWLGGLVPLITAVRAARRNPDQALPLALLIPRFSQVSIVCVTVLVLSGLYSYILQVNDLALLSTTTYGRALSIKLGLFVLLIILAAINLLVFSRRLRTAGNRLAEAFGRTVRIEIVAGALLLLAVGVMTSVAPSKAAWAEQQRIGIAEQATVDDVDLVLRAAPGRIGANEFAVDVTDKRAGAQNAPAKVLLNFGMVGMQMGELRTEARPTEAQRYVARGNFTSMAGRWQIEVVLRRAGFQDVRHTFEMNILASPIASAS